MSISLPKPLLVCSWQDVINPLWKHLTTRLSKPSNSVTTSTACCGRELLTEGALRLPGEVDDLLRLLDAPAASQSRHLNAAGLKRRFALPHASLVRDPESPELDTEPLDTSDPLTHDFNDIDPYVASAFRQLCRLKKREEALQKPRIRQLSLESQTALKHDAPAPPPDADPRWLIREGRWRAVIALLEPRISEASTRNPESLFYLAMAYWASGNDPRATELCRSARELILEGTQLDSILAALDTGLLQVLALLFWKAGDACTAKRLLDRCDQLLAQPLEGDIFFSVWRFKSVTREMFREDCHSQRQMIQGAAQGVAIRPYFLENQSGGA